MSADVRDAETGLAGILRVSAPVSFGEIYLQDKLADFRRKHPDLVIDLRLNDRYVDLVAEGYDLAIRIGSLEDSSLLTRRLAATRLIVVASPSYLERAGTPETPSDLANHTCLRDSNYRSGQSWQFDVDGVTQKINVRGPFLVNSATVTASLARRGEGIALCPDFAITDDIASGALVPLLTAYPGRTFGIQAVFSDARHMPARTRAALDYLATAFRTPPW